MNIQRILVVLLITGAIAPFSLPAQPLPAGDYSVMRLDFQIGQWNDLERATLFHFNWNSAPPQPVNALIADCSNPDLIGREFQLTAAGNPFFYSYPFPPPAEMTEPAVTGFINADASLFSLYRAPEPGLAPAVSRFGLGMRRADSLMDADLAGEWLQLFWEIETDSQGNVLGQGFDLAEIQLNADRTGFRQVLETSFEDEENFPFTWRPESGDLVVDVGGEVRFPVGASKDVIISPMVERNAEGGRQYIGFDLFMKRAASLAPEAVAGVWGLQFLDIEFGHGQWGPWKSTHMDKALLELRPDGTGTYYLMALSQPLAHDDDDEMVMDLAWEVAGGNIRVIVMEDGQQESIEFPVSAGANFALGFYGHADVQELDIFLKLDLSEVPKPVRHIPLYEPVRDGWGRIGFAGWAHTARWPWVYSANLGWLYFAEGDGRRVWMHDAQLGWLLTGPRMFPFFFGQGENEAYYLEVRSPVTPATRRFYAYHTGRWVD